jgi:hypothetical protein
MNGETASDARDQDEKQTRVIAIRGSAKESSWTR